MNIAILLAGHLRTWEFCKSWFEEKFIDQNHTIDIFVDTYNEIESSFPTNYQHLVQNNQLFKTEQEIKQMFNGLNVVDFRVESEISHEEYKPQADKLQQSYGRFVNYKKQTEKNYDLVVRSRFDLILEQKLDYNYIYDVCNSNKNFLFQSHINGINFGRDLNDQFAISTPDVMELYFKRFDKTLFPEEISENWCIFHSSLRGLTDYYAIQRNWESIHNALVRTESGGSYRIIW